MRQLLQVALGLLLQSNANAQQPPCPQVSVRLSSDTSCGSAIFQGTIKNNTCYSLPNGFSGMQMGHANDDRYNGRCVIFALLDPCSGVRTQDGVIAAEIAGGGAPYSGLGDYGTCGPVSKSRGPASYLTMICGTDSAVTGCPSKTAGSTTTNTLGPTGPTTTTTGPTKSTTTTTGPTTTPTTTTTTGGTANPTVTSAVNSVSSKLASASAAMSSYYANSTNAALASAAETAVESAGVSSSDARDVASDFSASSVIEKLDNLFEQVVKAAALIILAEVALDSASAASALEAVRAAGPLLSAAAAAAADPAQNPKPSTTRTTSSTTTTSDGPCTLCVACAESSLPRTTYTPSSFPTDVSKRSLDSRTESLDVALRDLSHADEDFITHILEKRSSQRFATYCGTTLQVPPYNSWSSTGTNTYKPYYDHYLTTKCGLWDWKFVSANTRQTLPVAPVNYDYYDTPYETEHPYEIQQVADFLEYARTKVPEFTQRYGTSGSAFCSGFFANQLNSTRVFAAQGLYDYSSRPISQIYGTLEGGTGGNASEFVYLEVGVNGRKGSFFGRKTPDSLSLNKQTTALALSTQAVIIAQYMQDSLVKSIYKTVSNRIRAQFVSFGRACNDSSALAEYRAFGTVDWAGTYDRWESAYIDTVQGNLVSYADTAAQRAYTLIENELKAANRSQVPLSQTKKFQYTQLLGQISARRSTYANARYMSLQGLKR